MILFSLVQATGDNINPREYLEDIMRRIMRHNAKSLDELTSRLVVSHKQPIC